MGKGYDENYGARFLRRIITNEVEDNLAVLLLGSNFQGIQTINVGVKGKSLYFRPLLDNMPLNERIDTEHGVAIL